MANDIEPEYLANPKKHIMHRSAVRITKLNAKNPCYHGFESQLDEVDPKAWTVFAPGLSGSAGLHGGG